MTGGRGGVPGSASLVLADGVRLLHPQPQLFEAMLEGWRNQMLARNLAVTTIEARRRQVRAFAEHTNADSKFFQWPNASRELCGGQHVGRLVNEIACKKDSVRNCRQRGIGPFCLRAAFG